MAIGMEAFDRFMDGADSIADMLSGKKPATPAPRAPSTPSSSTALAVDVHPIMEAVDAESGTTIYIVKHGNDRAECSSRKFAERVRRLLMENP